MFERCKVFVALHPSGRRGGKKVRASGWRRTSIWYSTHIARETRGRRTRRWAEAEGGVRGAKLTMVNGYVVVADLFLLTLPGLRQSLRTNFHLRCTTAAAINLHLISWRTNNRPLLTGRRPQSPLCVSESQSRSILGGEKGGGVRQDRECVGEQVK